MLKNTSLRVSVLALLVQLTGLYAATAQETGPLPVEIISDGATMRGRFFKADCGGHCPTLLIVPGQPGGTRDVMGLGTRLSSHGINVLMFNPRGHHQSEGTFTFHNTLDDIGAALAWLHDAANVDRFAIDTSFIGIGGYSFGGGMALAYAARDPRVRAVFALAGADHAEIIREYQRNAVFAKLVDDMLRANQAPNGPVRFDVDASLHELLHNQDLVGLRENAVRLADRRLLLLGGLDDPNVTMEHHLLPFYRALRQVGAVDVTFRVYQDDHGFSRSREQLAQEVRDWFLRRDAIPKTPRQENQDFLNRRL